MTPAGRSPGTDDEAPKNLQKVPGSQIAGDHENHLHQPVAEVISSTITGFTAECVSTNANSARSEANEVGTESFRPRFGGVLMVECPESGSAVFGVVYNVVTAPQDNVHKPSALGLSRERLRLEQPHIFSLLKTQVFAATIGHCRLGPELSDIHPYLPPAPPDVHDFVYRAEADAVRDLTSSFEFLRLLTYVSDVPQDELIAATIREARAQIGAGEEFLLEAGKALSSIFRNDYERLLSVLRKLK